MATLHTRNTHHVTCDANNIMTHSSRTPVACRERSISPLFEMEQEKGGGGARMRERIFVSKHSKTFRAAITLCVAPCHSNERCSPAGVEFAPLKCRATGRHCFRKRTPLADGYCANDMAQVDGCISGNAGSGVFCSVVIEVQAPYRLGSDKNIRARYVAGKPSYKTPSGLALDIHHGRMDAAEMGGQRLALRLVEFEGFS
ncbi:hypothetical protein JTE90_018669 [Oedothorax gibbosus]|uniref:Uncharacterized protein n=1 Tax=Oedothorax gibbosus TaxID=931172 RepID=A0AAV6V228_9ARAC|nr:hypothetical protein JTE90_018669 [Oedothorax gibbosus]